MKVITKFVNFIANCVDKFIVMPVTKLAFRVRKSLNKPNRKFESWLSKPTTLLFVSLFLSILIFIVVDQKIISFSNSSAEVLKDRKVEVIYNSEQYVVEGLPELVDVTLIGSKADLYIAKQSTNNGVTVDLTGLKPGTHKVNLEYDQGTYNIEYTVNPSVATVIIYEKVSGVRSLSYEILNSDDLDSTLVIEDVSLNIDEITVRGAQYKIDQVAVVKALIDVDDLTIKTSGKETLNDIQLKAYDKDGNVVDVEFSTEKISAEVEVSSPSKTLSLNFAPKGDLPTGKAIASYTLSQNEVVVYGNSEILANMDAIDVEIDVSDLTSDKKLKVEIPKPSGVKSMSANYITISLNVTDSSSEPANFTISLTGENIGEGLTAQPVDDENGFIPVEVKGASSILGNIKEEDITAYVDLSGLTEGEYELDVKVKGSNPLATYIAKKTKAKIRIYKKK